MSILGDKDSINKAMVEGIRHAFRQDLKDILMETAEKEVDVVVESLSSRIELNIDDWKTFSTDSRHIKMEWIITKR